MKRAGWALLLAGAFAADSHAQAPPVFGLPSLSPDGSVRWRAPGLGAPALAADGSVRWSAPAFAPPDGAADLPLRTAADTVLLWSRVATRDSILRPYALRALARAKLALADTAGADSALAAGASAPSLWHWPLVQARAELWRARGQTARADGLLEATDRAGWPDADRAAWLALRGRLREEMGDTMQAIGFARQVVRLYPSFGVARGSVAALERLTRARRDSLGFEDERAAGEAERFAGSRAGAERRYTRALRLADPASRGAVALKLAELRRLLRRFAEAERALAVARAAAGDAGARADVLLERARLDQSRGAPDTALVAFGRAADAADSSRREPFLMELARELERAGRFGPARAALGRVIAAGGRRSADAAFRIGLLHYAEGRTDSALARWEGAGSEPAAFWHAVALRAKARALGDTAARRPLESRAADSLRSLAGRPGYSFYRAAARDTLGIRSWPGRAVLAAAPAQRLVESARTLAALGMPADAASLLSRWNAGDPRLNSSAATPEERLAGAAAAYAIGAPALGIAIADRTVRALEDSLDPRAWPAQPWLYPPAFDSLAHGTSGVLEPALTLAIIRQESRFDPRARSTSNALGLMQLKLPTARDMARRLRERTTFTEEDLFQPARNIRYGTAYFDYLIRRFGGGASVGLSAYNAGPSTIPAHTAALLARGGEALFTEFASNATAQDYIRKILTNRAAYRELGPRSR